MDQCPGFREWPSHLCRVPRQQKGWKTLLCSHQCGIRLHHAAHMPISFHLFHMYMAHTVADNSLGFWCVCILIALYFTLIYAKTRHAQCLSIDIKPTTFNPKLSVNVDCVALCNLNLAIKPWMTHMPLPPTVPAAVDRKIASHSSSHAWTSRPGT